MGLNLRRKFSDDDEIKILFELKIKNELLKKLY
jgi:hypothetical protein